MVTLKEGYDIDYNAINIDDEWNDSEKIELRMHTIHAYPAKFPAFIASKAFEYARNEGVDINKVADIFCGCGTVALESKLHNYDFWGCDINPVATLIAKTKSSDYDVEQLERYYIIIEQSMVITEVLTESHLYELSLDESMVNEIIKRRDSTLRQLALSDKMGIPTAAMFLKDSLDNPSGLEEAVARVLTVFGFEVTPIGGNGEPDGKAEACLGFSEEGKNKSYSLTYDAKSTAKNKIAAATAHLSGLRRHREAYNADFSLEVAVDYQGAEDELSAISVEAKNEKVTMMTAKDLIKLLLLITPKQIGLDKLRELFETCYMPQDVHEWIENIEKTEVEKPPYYELVDVVYELQKTDSEAPELGTIRYKLKEKMNKNYSKMQVREWLVLLSNLIPGCVTIDGNYVGVQASAQIIKERIHKAINDMPLGYKPLYDEIFK